MTHQEVILTRIGTKGQIVIGQKLRERYHLAAGMIVKQMPTTQGIVIQAFDKKRVMQKIDALSHAVGKKWPKHLDCVAVIERR
ncbi:MAG: hypothetical protein Q8R53_01895 [Nanoarchaeota archaeon]|nr:hypothetical protein [Nanoarchaeota archaeon]